MTIVISVFSFLTWHVVLRSALFVGEPRYFVVIHFFARSKILRLAGRYYSYLATCVSVDIEFERDPLMFKLRKLDDKELPMWLTTQSHPRSEFHRY